MRTFAYGNDAQFNELWGKLTGNTSKRISFDVTLKPSIRATIAFSSNNGGVKVKLTLAETNAGQSYGGNSEFIRSLLSGNEIEFATLAEMKEKFLEVKADYMPQTTTEQSDTPIRKLLGCKIINQQWLAAKIKEQIVGQDAQIDGIALSVCNHLRKRNPKKPLTIMLPGPTGVGKTATARLLAEILQEVFGKEQLPLIVVKCNELKEEYRISQLLGSPAGYVGYSDPCMLQPLKRTNSAIIVFDEFEKAHSSIHTSVMDWMDSGKVTFSHIDEGEETGEYDCAASIIIMTSNIDMGGSAPDMRFVISPQNAATVQQTTSTHETNEHCREVMRRGGFKPEIAARIQYFFEYKALSPADIKKVLVLAFKKKAKEYGAIIDSVSESLTTDIHRRYAGSRFGVRPLENDLDEKLGQQIPQSVLTEDKHFNAGGTLDNIIFTEVA